MPMSLIPGQKVPPLKVGLQDGSSYDLATESPENFSVIFVYRGYHCPICKTQLEDLAGRLDDFAKAGISVVAISMDSNERLQKTVEEWDTGDLRLGYNLTPDSATQWGLFLSESISDAEPPQFAEPAIFVVKPDRTLYSQYLQNVPFARPRSDDLLSGLEFILEKNYPVRGTLSGLAAHAE